MKVVAVFDRADIQIGYGIVAKSERNGVHSLLINPIWENLNKKGVEITEEGESAERYDATLSEQTLPTIHVIEGLPYAQGDQTYVKCDNGITMSTRMARNTIITYLPLYKSGYKISFLFAMCAVIKDGDSNIEAHMLYNSLETICLRYARYANNFRTQTQEVIYFLKTIYGIKKVSKRSKIFEGGKLRADSEIFVIFEDSLENGKQ